MRLQKQHSPDQKFGYYQLSVPLAASGLITSIIIALCGASRFFRQQNAISRGKAYAGGWELMTVGMSVGLVSEDRDWQSVVVAMANFQLLRLVSF